MSSTNGGDHEHSDEHGGKASSDEDANATPPPLSDPALQALRDAVALQERRVEALRARKVTRQSLLSQLRAALTTTQPADFAELETAAEELLAELVERQHQQQHEKEEKEKLQEGHIRSQNWDGVTSTKDGRTALVPTASPSQHAAKQTSSHKAQELVTLAATPPQSCAAADQARTRSADGVLAAEPPLSSPPAAAPSSPDEGDAAELTKDYEALLASDSEVTSGGDAHAGQKEKKKKKRRSRRRGQRGTAPLTEGGCAPIGSIPPPPFAASRHTDVNAPPEGEASSTTVLSKASKTQLSKKERVNRRALFAALDQLQVPLASSSAGVRAGEESECGAAATGATSAEEPEWLREPAEAEETACTAEVERHEPKAAPLSAPPPSAQGSSENVATNAATAVEALPVGVKGECEAEDEVSYSDDFEEEEEEREEDEGD